MPLTSGTRLGPYEITGAIGAGGMGEVYRARDTRLGREVAIKILPQHLADTPEARQRFEREAKAVSSLNHPHICTLHDVGHQDGIDFLVMEYLEGETLADRLAKGPLPSEQVLKIGIEICEGLEKAHRTGVVHRDLKPGNIMLTKTGAKLLDFGLAKPLEAAPAMSLTAMPTSSKAMEAAKPVTAEGTIVGTFQYMSPEQLEGKEADERSDIFALGAVLYEMATGRRAFEGKSQTSVIAAILEREPPPISSLQPMSPPALDRVVKLCLAKDPDERIQSSHDVKLQLEWIRDAGSQAGAPAPVSARRKLHERVWISATALFATLATLSTIGYVLRASKPGPTIAAEISPPANASFEFSGVEPAPPALSPDGRRLVFGASGKDGKELLWVRSLDSTTAQSLAGTEDAHYPFWSTDSRFIGFFAHGKLSRIDAGGGAAIAIADGGGGRGGSWGPDGTVLFAPRPVGPIFRVPASGGTPQPVTKLNESLREHTHRWPQFLPDGRRFLFQTDSGIAQSGGTYVASLGGGEPRLLLGGDSNAVYAPPGYLLFIRQGILMAQRFDAKKLQLSGDAVPLAEHAEVNLQRMGIFTVSENGILIYEAGGPLGGDTEILWFNRDGKQSGVIGTPGEYAAPRLSPDGRELAVTMAPPETSGSNIDIWIYDLARGIPTRLTFSPATDAEPSWSPDGKTIAFTSDRNGPFHLYQKAADGASSTTPLVVDDASETWPDWSSDGRYVLYVRHESKDGSHTEIWALPLFGDRKPFPVVQNRQFDQDQPALSPDGKWLSFVSTEAGRPEVYIAPFRSSGGKILVSTNGGFHPTWRRDGRELFYLSLGGFELLSAEVSEMGASVTIGKITSLFPPSLAPGPTWPYDVTANGEKFVVVSRGAQQATAPLTLVTDWPALLKKE